VGPGLPGGIHILASGEDAAGLWGRLQVSPDSPCFDGHFEAQPVLPGIAQLGILLGLLAARGEARGLDGVRSLKLKRLVRPGDVLEVRVTRPGADGVSSFETRAQGEVVASGSVVTSPLSAGVGGDDRV
jgi:3-hydroxyacyl-[acyl-carrier-protein] dehydratase